MAPGYELQKQYFLGVVGYVQGQWERERNRRQASCWVVGRKEWWRESPALGAVGGAVSMLERKAEGR